MRALGVDRGIHIRYLAARFLQSNSLSSKEKIGINFLIIIIFFYKESNKEKVWFQFVFFVKGKGRKGVL